MTTITDADQGHSTGDWSYFDVSERVRLNQKYHGFPTTDGTLCQILPYGLVILFDGENKQRVIPRTMVEKCNPSKE